jgi:hypothetical protein
MSIKSLLVLLYILWIAVAILLLKTYNEFKYESEFIIELLALVSSLMTIYQFVEFIKRKK